MLTKERIIEVLARWNFWGRELAVGVNRAEYVEKLLKFVKTDKVVSIVGIRRGGKSTIIRQVAKALMDSGTDPRDILIINFEEPEFEGANVSFLTMTYEAYLEIIKPLKKPFVFLDEIQNVEKWEKFVRSVNERKEAYLTVTGSPSKIVSDELATILTGRQLYFEVFPLSYHEYLKFKDIKIKDRRDIIVNASKIKSLLREYLEFGGFPEIVLNKDVEFKLRTLRSYYEDIINRDIVQRHKVKKVAQLKTLIRFYLTNISTLITFNRISKFINLPTETVRTFSSYAEGSNMIFFINRFSWSVKEQEKSPRKVYAKDVGLSNAVGFRFSENIGKLAENAVAIELKRRQAADPLLEIYYWKDPYGKEVDFVVKRGAKIVELIQVCWDISDAKVKGREIKALLDCFSELKLKHGLIITEDYEAEETVKGNKIKFIPLWKWLSTPICLL